MSYAKPNMYKVRLKSLESSVNFGEWPHILLACLDWTRAFALKDTPYRAKVPPTVQIAKANQTCRMWPI